MDNSTEQYRRANTRFARMYLNNWLITGKVHELEKSITILQAVAASYGEEEGS